MAYTPKSQIKHRKIKGELVFKGTNAPYTGNAMEFSNGKIYEGGDRNNPGRELVPNTKMLNSIQSIDEMEPNAKYFSFSMENRNYNISNQKINNFLSDKKVLPSSKPLPSEEQYQRTYFRRYFARRINGDFYM